LPNIKSLRETKNVSKMQLMGLDKSAPSFDRCATLKNISEKRRIESKKASGDYNRGLNALSKFQLMRKQKEQAALEGTLMPDIVGICILHKMKVEKMKNRDDNQECISPIDYLEMLEDRETVKEEVVETQKKLELGNTLDEVQKMLSRTSETFEESITAAREMAAVRSAWLKSQGIVEDLESPLKKHEKMMEEIRARDKKKNAAK